MYSLYCWILACLIFSIYCNRDTSRSVYFGRELDKPCCLVYTSQNLQYFRLVRKEPPPLNTILFIFITSFSFCFFVLSYKEWPIKCAYGFGALCFVLIFHNQIDTPCREWVHAYVDGRWVSDGFRWHGWYFKKHSMAISFLFIRMESLSIEAISQTGYELFLCRNEKCYWMKRENQLARAVVIRVSLPVAIIICNIINTI